VEPSAGGSVSFTDLHKQRVRICILWYILISKFIKKIMLLLSMSNIMSRLFVFALNLYKNRVNTTNKRKSIRLYSETGPMLEPPSVSFPTVDMWEQ
jgi:hypothetical protein